MSVSLSRFGLAPTGEPMPSANASPLASVNSVSWTRAAVCRWPEQGHERAKRGPASGQRSLARIGRGLDAGRLLMESGPVNGERSTRLASQALVPLGFRRFSFSTCRPPRARARPARSAPASTGKPARRQFAANQAVGGALGQRANPTRLIPRLCGRLRLDSRRPHEARRTRGSLLGLPQPHPSRPGFGRGRRGTEMLAVPARLQSNTSDQRVLPLQRRRRSAPWPTGHAAAMCSEPQFRLSSR